MTVVAGVATVALAACGLPTSGEVRQGLPLGGSAAPSITLQFEAPSPDATPEEIVSGFFAAQWSADDDYRAARAYLTPQAAAEWHPESVVVHPDDASPAVQMSAANRIATVSVAEAGVLDSTGRFQASPVGATRQVEFAMDKSSGQWRIASLPDKFGLWLSEFYFDRAYRQVQVAYVSRGANTLVPDWRRLGVGSGLPTSLARAMLGPVPDYLSSAVTGGYPPGSALTVEAVPVENGLAQVDLNTRVLQMDSSSRRAAWAQALQTMRQVPGIDDVALTVEGQPLELVGHDSPPRRLADLGFESAPERSPVVVRRVGETLTAVSSSSFPLEVDSPRVPDLPPVPERWRYLGVSLDLRDAAAVDASRSSAARWVDAKPVPVSVPGSELTTPAFDAEGWAWLGGRDASGTATLWALPPAASPAPEQIRRIEAPWLADREIIDVRPAPEGYRVAVVSRGAEGRARVEIAGVVRAGDGAPAALSQPLAVAGDVAAARSLSWIDDRSLGMVGARTLGGVPGPLVSDLSDLTDDLGIDEEVRSLVSLGGQRGLVAVTTSDVVVRRVGAGWQPVETAHDIVVPGR